MAGSLLRSGGLKEFYALGAVGHPVYMSATQLRVAIRNQLGKDVAAIFSIPQRNERGDTIDWYAPEDGSVVPWSAATEEERAAAKAQLEEIQQRVLSSAEKLEQNPDSERQVFGRLLSHAMTFPDDTHVYLVNDQPVLTFWGFRRHDAASTTNALGLLPVAEPKVPATDPLPAIPEPTLVEEKKRRFPWWLWPLLLLLLLLLALFLLRSCQEEPPVQPPAAELQPAPLDQAAMAAMTPEEREAYIRRYLQTTGSTLLSSDGTVLSAEEAAELAGQGEELMQPTDTQAPVDPEGEETPPSEEEMPPLPDEGLPPEALPQEQQEETPQPEEQPAEEPQEQPQQPESPQDPTQQPPEEEQPQSPEQGEAGDEASEPPALNIPQQSLDQGKVDFMKGDWSSSTGLMDERGRPMQLEYQFDDQGEGQVTLKRSDGSVCTGSTRASSENGQLVIQDQSTIRCPDGKAYQPSKVNCSVGENGQANCQGGYDSGNSFPVEIRQSSQ